MMNNTQNTEPRIYISDLSDEALSEHIRACTADPETMYLSVDCEMMGLKPHRDRLCLVQMCDSKGNVSLVKIEQGQETAQNLQILLEHPDITKIFHFARADMAHLSQQLGISVRPVFCTKIASKLARTYTERHGLRELLRETLGVELNKQQQSSDWGRDTLTRDQVDYAASDVLYLIEAKKKLTEMLIRENRLDLAYRCFEQIQLMADLDLQGFDFTFEHHSPK